MPNDRPAAIKGEMISDCDKIAILRKLLTDAWADPPMEGEAEYWRGILTAIGTIIEI